MKEMSRLSTALHVIRERFFAFDEFPNVNRSRFPAGICEAAMKINRDDLAFYSASRTAKELEAMILDFPALETTEEWGRISHIIMSRFSPRIIKLIFQLFQVYYTSEAVQYLVKKLIDEADRRQQFPEQGRFIWIFGESCGSFSSELETAFQDAFYELDRFFQTFNINRATPLAMELRCKFLEHADFPAILKNSHHLIDLIGTAPESLIKQTITNYIRHFDVLNTEDEINKAILNRYGDPSCSESWSEFAVEEKRKFSQWCFCHRLMLHSARFSSKYKVLSQYYERVKQSLLLEEVSGLVIEFERIILVDLSDKPYSCFYLREDFEREMKKWVEFDILPSFLEDDKLKVSARDYIIEEKDDSCILLYYEGIDLLYIKELLDIKFGLVPEYRKRKLN